MKASNPFKSVTSGLESACRAELLELDTRALAVGLVVGIAQ